MYRKFFKRSLISCILLCFILNLVSFSGIDAFYIGKASAAGEVKVQLFNPTKEENTYSFSAFFKLVNNSGSSLSLSNVKMRYYFTHDNSFPIERNIDYASSGNNNVTATLVTGLQYQNADSYLEIGFNSGTLSSGQSTDVQLRIWDGNYNNKFNLYNDYSYNKTASSYVDWSKVTCYINGVKVWGDEPAALSLPTPTVTPVIPTPSSTPTPLSSAAVPSVSPSVSPTASALSTPTPSPTPTDLMYSLAPARVPVPSVTEIPLKKSIDVSYNLSGDVKVRTVSRPKEVLFLLDSSSNLIPGQNPILPFFQYLLLSETNLDIIGDYVEVKGDIYAKNAFNSSAGNILVDGGRIECSDMNVNGPLNVQTSLNSLKTNLSRDLKLEDLDFYTKIVDYANQFQARTDGYKVKYYRNDPFFPGVNLDVAMPGQTNVNIRYTGPTGMAGNSNRPTFKITGGGTFKINSDMYFDGNLEISLGAVEGVTDSFILAEGDIIIQGNNASGNFNNIYLYSRHGNIKFESGYSTISGMAIAPEGELIFNGNHSTFYGNYIGNKLTNNASNITFNRPLKDPGEVLDPYVEYTSDLSILTQQVSNCIAALKTMDRDYDVKVGVIKYSGNANAYTNNDDTLLDNDYAFYNVSDNADYNAIGTRLTNLKPDESTLNNPGDALRRAYHIFNGPSSDPNALKYVIFMTGNIPNACSYEDAAATIRKDGPGDAAYTKTSGDAIPYAEHFGEKLNGTDPDDPDDDGIAPPNHKIKTLFVDLTSISSKINIALLSIADKAGVTTTNGRYFKPIAVDQIPFALNNTVEFIKNDIGKMKVIEGLVVKSAIFEEILPKNVVPEEITISDSGTKYKVKKDSSTNKLKIYDESDNLSTIWTLEEDESDDDVRYKLVGKLSGYTLDEDTIDPANLGKYKLIIPEFKIKVSFTADESTVNAIADGTNPNAEYKVNNTFNGTDAKLTLEFADGSNNDIDNPEFNYNDITITVVHKKEVD